MSDILNRIEDSADKMLRGIDSGLRNEDVIKSVILKQAEVYKMLQSDFFLEDEDVNRICRRIQERFSINVEPAWLIDDGDPKPWLNKYEIEWYYWGRHKRYLEGKQYSKKVISEMDHITDQILDRIGDPNEQISWKRKGMVVGHVQSGKTANYTSLICKAADAGYKIIIVLAGMLNSLRNQTQERIDEGFVGLDSIRFLDETIPMSEKLIGVGEYERERLPVSFTNKKEDFKKGTANTIIGNLSAFSEPLVVVVKKNANTLKNLYNWLDGTNTSFGDFPMLVIDDEADHASINTKQDSEETTAINKGIRKLLNLFNRSSYVGYTATPFANIFIEPETESEMLGDDLFPKHFIINLEAPDNYIGPDTIFSEEPKLDIVRTIWDNGDLLPIRHEKNFSPDELPESLKEAVSSFVLIRSIRLLRKQEGQHNSMMINVSRFTIVQSNVRVLVDKYLDSVKEAIKNYSLLSEEDALKNSLISQLKVVWEKEFDTSEFRWGDVQRKLSAACDPIDVIEVNSSANAEPLDYDKKTYPNGRNVIAVGGLSLSRGLTLEGLTVSYFLRNSIMYDTLMQMGRWFGYRDYYSDLCRLYMTEDARSWYAHIAGVVQELRREFHRMKMANLTPRDFGLCVRCHPEALIVTARNKMRSGKTVSRQIGLAGRVVESNKLLKDRKSLDKNYECLKNMIEYANENGIKVNEGKRKSIKGCFWENVPFEGVVRFVNSFIHHQECVAMAKEPLTDYIHRLSKKEDYDTWHVALIGLSNAKREPVNVVPGVEVIPETRTCSIDGGNNIVCGNRRVATGGDEIVGLTDEQISQIEKSGNKLSDSDYREKRNKPLLMLHVIDFTYKDAKGQKEKTIKSVAACSLAFPYGGPNEHVEYKVNTVWWQKEYADSVEDNEDVEYETK